MPTGYTCYIENGRISSASDFVMLCARNFGALMYMRDEPLSAPIPKEIKPDDMYYRSLQSARESLAKYKGMSLSDAQEQMNADYEKEIVSVQKSKEKAEQLRRNYLKILRDVKAWIPPTLEHEGLKAFVIEQIEMSIPNMSIYERAISKAKPDVEEWLSAKIASRTNDIAYYQKMIQKENERCASCNRWVRDLMESLEGQK